MSHSSNTSNSNSLNATDVSSRHIAFLKHSVETLYSYAESQSHALFVDFTRGCSGFNVVHLIGNARRTFDCCFGEWLFSGGMFEYEGKLQHAADVLLSLVRPDSEENAYFASLRNSSLHLYRVVDFYEEDLVITVRDALHDKPRELTAHYSPLSPALHKDEIVGLRLLQNFGELFTGYGIYRFTDVVQQDLPDRLRSIAAKVLQEYPDSDRDALDRTVITDSIIKVWLIMVDILERQMQQVLG